MEREAGDRLSRRGVVLHCLALATHIAQVPRALALADAETLSRSLRQVQKLLDADGLLLPVDLNVAVAFAADANGGSPGDDRAAGPVGVLLEAARRLTLTLGPAVRLGVHLPGPATLAAARGRRSALADGWEPAAASLAGLTRVFADAGCRLLVLQEDPPWPGRLYPAELAEQMARAARPIWNIAAYFGMTTVLQTSRFGAGAALVGAERLSLPDPGDLPADRLVWQLPVDPLPDPAALTLPRGVTVAMNCGELTAAHPLAAVRALVERLHHL